MRWLALLVSITTLAGCACNGPSVSSRYGELVVVQRTTTGREQLVREAVVTVPATSMSTVGAGEVPVRNVGQETVSVLSVTRLEGDASLGLEDAVGLVVERQADAVLPVRFAPPQAADATQPQVTHRAKFELILSGARPGEERLVIELVGDAVARDCYVPRRLDFGLVPLQQGVRSTLELVNGGALPATTTFGAVEGPDPTAFVLEAQSPLAVPAGGRVAFSVRFTPLEARPYAARVSMQRDATCPMAVLELVGEGSDQALSWSPARLDFGRLPLGVAVTREVTVLNRSNVELSLTGLLGSPDYALEAGAPTSVPARGSATVRVTCAPLSLGPRDALLTLELGTVPVTPARIPLACVGGGPRVRVDPNPLQFGQVPLRGSGFGVTRRRVLVQNVGTAPPAPGDPAHNLVLGRRGTLPWFAIVPKNGLTRVDEFNVSLLGRYDNAVGLPAVAGSNFAEFEVSVSPTSGGLREADLVVYSNDAAQPELRVPITASPRLSEGCTATVTPEGADFGPTPRGAIVTRTVTIANTGTTTACLVSGIELAPGSDLTFAVIDPAVPSMLVAPGERRSIRVQAVVSNAANIGDYLRGTLRFGIGGEPRLRELPVDLRVSRCLAVDPPLIDLGLVQEGCTSGTKYFTLYNVCGLPISLVGHDTPAPPFRVVSSPVGAGPVTLLPSGQVQVGVALGATASGTFSEVLTFQTDEAGALQAESVALRGRVDPTGQQTESYAQGSGEVDILLVIDDSCSMGDEQAALATNFAAFMSAAAQGNGNWRIGVTTTDTLWVKGELKRTATNPAVLTPTTPNVAALFSDKVRVGTSGNGLEQPFAAMALAVTEPNRSGANANFLRRDATLAVVIVTDAEEQSPNSVGSYLSQLRAAKQNRPELVSVSVVGPFSAPSTTCFTEGVIDNGRYASAITQTGGVKSNICTQDWAMDLSSISQNLFANRRTFELSGLARGMGDVRVLVDGQVVTTGWRYDAALNAVVFTQAPRVGASVVIEYRTACF